MRFGLTAPENMGPVMKVYEGLWGYAARVAPRVAPRVGPRAHAPTRPLADSVTQGLRESEG